ncbi:hypothetical protein BCR36DRAFT_252267, partial [Piromyces finnis]
WSRRLGPLKATNLKEIMIIMNDIIELFKLLENSCMNKSNMEKITIIYNALPNILMDKILMSSQYTPETLYEIIKTDILDNNSFNTRNARNGNNHYNNPFINEYRDFHDDYMDIDNIEKKYTKDKRINKYHHRNNKYCIICNISGHSVKDCHYNPCRPTRTKK